jgi:hypothetical protein
MGRKGKVHERHDAVSKLIGQLDEHFPEYVIDEDISVSDLEKASEEAPVIRLVHHLLLVR